MITLILFVILRRPYPFRWVLPFTRQTTLHRKGLEETNGLLILSKAVESRELLEDHMTSTTTQMLVQYQAST